MPLIVSNAMRFVSAFSIIELYHILLYSVCLFSSRLSPACLETGVWICYNRRMKKKIFINNLLSLSLANAATTILYFAQMNRLYNFFEPNTVYLVTISYAYFAQGLGLLLFMLLCRYRPGISRNKYVIIGAMTAFVPLLILTLLVRSGAVLMLLLLMTNLLIGYVLAHFFTALAVSVDEKHIGMCWGSAYAVGNLLSWAASKIDATFLTPVKIIPTICIAIATSVIQLMLSGDQPVIEAAPVTPKKEDAQKYLYVFVVIVLMSVIYTIGSTDYFMIAEEMTTGSTFYTRCMYAAGLFIAGIMYDKSHKLSAVFALASIIYPVMASILIKIPFQIDLIYCLSFFSLGFFAVYRSCVFISIGCKNKGLIYLSGLGLLISRITEGLFSLINTYVARSEVLGFIITGGLFVPLIVVFCMMFLNPEPAKETAKELSEEEKLIRFSEAYKLTRREEEIVVFLLKGATNGEIAEALTISEGTTRFHVSNVLKKTECKTRNDVVHKFRQG